MVTDGVTEALSPDDEEFGDERVLEALRRRAGEHGGGRAARACVAAVERLDGRRGLRATTSPPWS